MNKTQQYTEWSEEKESCWLVPVNSGKSVITFSMHNKDQSSLIGRINFNRLLRPGDDLYDFINLDNK